MQPQLTLYSKRLDFTFSAGTTSGYYTARDTWFVVLQDANSILGIGECAPLPGLSQEFVSREQYEKRLSQGLELINRKLSAQECISLEEFKDAPSVRFGLETALRQAEAKGSFQIFDNAFTRGEQTIPINGLVWMGNFEEMRRRLIQKIEEGFTCIKLKIGAIDFEKELELIKMVRSEFSARHLILRVDAN